MTGIAAAPDRVATLRANLAALGERHGDLADRLRAITPRADAVLRETPQGVPGLEVAGVPLCSRHRPLDEADRLVARVDVVEHAVVVVLGFGAGYHVQRLAERLGRAGLIVVFEPDLALLRSVLEQLDHSRWLAAAQVVLVTDATDRGGLSRRLQGAESIIAQGVSFLEHPPSRARLAPAASQFASSFADLVATTRTTFLTTLMRAVDTVRNMLLNVDHYAAGGGIEDLRDAASGHPAVVVSAGPSLARSMDLLAQPGLRDRCVILAAQTTLRPLLRAGVRPHFVTALDYHGISRRFYEGLDADAVRGVTLIAEPKAHPVILDSFPGPVRCCSSEFLDLVLGPLARPMGSLPAGATVAHLATYAARHLGCDPIILVGQDLAFTDGLYYAPGTAIDEVWAPELNAFNTIEMMQWQRIARHRRHLSRHADVRGRPVYSDAQMVAYLQQFERDFAGYREQGVRIIDATGGGLPKQHAERQDLDAALRAFAVRPLPPLPAAPAPPDARRLRAVSRRLAEVRERVGELGETARRTAGLLSDLLGGNTGPAQAASHLARIDAHRRDVDANFEAFRIVNHLNQLGVFRRFRSDRRLHMQQPEGDELARARLRRDLDNVTWIADAADEMRHLLRLAGDVADGRPVGEAEHRTRLPSPDDERGPAAPTPIAALVPVDPERSGLGVRRSLAERLEGRTVVQATLERLGRVAGLDGIVLIAPRGLDVEPWLDRDAIGRPVRVERCEGSPFGPEQAAVAAARRWSPESWRGGVAGMSVYDEVLCPTVMAPLMERLGLAAGLLIAPDWPLVDPVLCAGVLARHRERPGRHALVFTQAPPGLAGCLVSARLMRELALRNRLSTIGGLLVYQPQAPQPDPIAGEANVAVEPPVRGARLRAAFDLPADRGRVRRATAILERAERADAAAVIAALERADAEAPEAARHVVLEINGRRDGRFRPRPARAAPDLDPATVERELAPLLAPDGTVLTLDGAGDPLRHPRLEEVIAAARRAGVAAVHVRTELRGGQDVERLLAAAPEIVSVDLHADSAGTYRRVMGVDGFERVVGSIRRLVDGRRRLSEHPPAAALGLPWVVPRMQRRDETVAEIDGFYERWQGHLGAALLEPADPPDATLLPAPPPARLVAAAARDTVVLRSDWSRVGAD